MIAILGASGFIGSHFARYLETLGVPCAALGRPACDYYDARALAGTLADVGAEFLINCAGYTGKPNVDACEDHKAACLLANAVLPSIVAEACRRHGIPWGHVSSGCIYTGDPGGRGFTEEDRPNFSFRQDNCSFYSGSKALGEECLAGAGDIYIWRTRIPFSHIDSPRNYISKLMHYDRLLDARNSLSSLDQFVRACWECWHMRLPFGIWNLTNTGSITTREVTRLIRDHGLSDKTFRFFGSEAEFMQVAARAPRSSTVLDNTKARDAGLRLDPVEEALDDAMRNWVPR